MGSPAPHLLGNTGQEAFTTQEGGFDQGDYAQSFQTAGQGGGFPLRSVDLRLDVSPGQSFPTVTLHTGSATGTKVADFLPPTSKALGLSDYKYRVAAPITLSTSTTYWVVVQGGSAATWQTTSGGADSGSLPGWLFSTRGQSRQPNTSTGSFSDLTGTARRFMLSVNGVESAPQYLASNLERPLLDIPRFRLGTDNDMAKQFRTGGNPAGYSLTGLTLKIRSESLAVSPHCHASQRLRKRDDCGQVHRTSQHKDRHP